MEFSELILTHKLDRVVMHAPLQKPLDGTLCVTGHHLILSSRQKDVEELWLIHEDIDMLEKRPSNICGGTITVKCKDFRIIKLEITSSNEDFNNLATTLERLSFLDTVYKYPFFYRPMYVILEDGWTAFQTEIEFGKLLQGDEWRISLVNSDYNVCPSYPKVVVVPKVIDDETIIASSKFRDGGRFPVLSYRHEGGAVLLRSGQPLTGANNRRCKEDERLINCVIRSGRRGYVIDTRSQTNAQAAKARGGGFEIEMHYPQWKRINNAIDRRNTLLESLSKLIEACNDTNCSLDKWLSRLDSSNWLSLIRETLNCSCLVAQFLDQEGASVLVHGSEGVDSTLIVTSLSQIILNPDCRTVRGLEAVIEREWLQGGYPFSSRHSHFCYSSPSMRTKSEAPTFLLFLDCVYQLYYQFPCSFEFLPSFLIWLFEHSYFSQFGTFLGNNEMERETLELSKKTSSLWSYVNRPEILQTILNPIYEPNNSVIWPSVAPVSIELWSGLYLRWVDDQSLEKEKWEDIAALKSKEKELRLQAGRLRRQLLDLVKEVKQLSPTSEYSTSSLQKSPAFEDPLTSMRRNDSFKPSISSGRSISPFNFHNPFSIPETFALPENFSLIEPIKSSGSQEPFTSSKPSTSSNKGP